MISIGKQLVKVGIDKIWLLAVLILKFNRIAKRASLGGKEEVTLHQFQVFLSIGFPTYKNCFPTYKHFPKDGRKNIGGMFLVQSDYLTF